MAPKRTPRKPAPSAARKSPVPQSESGSAINSGVTSDLVTLAGQIPAEILQQLAAAIRAGHWLFAVWHVADGRIHLQRTATSFPIADLDKAVSLISDSVKELATSAS